MTNINSLFGRSKFITSISKIDSLKNYYIPEFAFWGRSNVGKSSLINVLLNNSKLAHTSKTPGKTRLINLFDVNNKFIISDLPGYGYAKVDKKSINQWLQLNYDYISSSQNLHNIFLLIDSRRNIKENDLEIMQLLDSIPISYQIIFTKIDKIGKNAIKELKEQANAITSNCIAINPVYLLTSANKSHGMDDLRKCILNSVKMRNH